jgi:hypothetical protein
MSVSVTSIPYIIPVRTEVPHNPLVARFHFGHDGLAGDGSGGSWIFTCLFSPEIAGVYGQYGLFTVHSVFISGPIAAVAGLYAHIHVESRERSSPTAVGLRPVWLLGTDGMVGGQIASKPTLPLMRFSDSTVVPTSVAVYVSPNTNAVSVQCFIFGAIYDERYITSIIP